LQYSRGFWHYATTPYGEPEGIRIGVVAVKTNAAGYETYPYVWKVENSYLEVMPLTHNAFSKIYYYVRDCTGDEDTTVHELLKMESDRANDLVIEQAQKSVEMKVKKKVIAENAKSNCNGKCVLGEKRLATINSQAAELKKLRSTNVSTTEITKLKGNVAKLTTQLTEATEKIKVKTTAAKEVTNKKHDDLVIQFTTLQTTHTAMKAAFTDEIKQVRLTQQSIPFNSVVPSPRYTCSQDMTQNIIDLVPVQQTNMMNMTTPLAMMQQQFRNLQQQQQQQMAALLGGNRDIRQGAFGLF
jgi:hypothetical protein